MSGLVFAVDLLVTFLAVYFAFWLGVLAGERGILRISWPKRLALPPRRPPARERSLERVRERMGKIARDLYTVRQSGQYSEIGVIYHHWFDCLSWVLGVDVEREETLDQKIARVIVEFPVSGTGRLPAQAPPGGTGSPRVQDPD